MKHIKKFDVEITESDTEYLLQCFIDFFDGDPRTKSTKSFSNGRPSWNIIIFSPVRKIGSYQSVYHRDIKYIDDIQAEIEQELNFYDNLKNSIEKGLNLKKDVRVEIDRSLTREGYILSISFIIPYLLNKP